MKQAQIIKENELNVIQFARMSRAERMFKSLRLGKKKTVKIDFDNYFSHADKLQIFNPNPSQVTVKQLEGDELEMYEARKEEMQMK